MGEGEETRRERAAVALRYVAGETEVPRVVAAGRGALAERILARARECGVPVHEDPELAAALLHVDVGGEIPPELYLAVAEVLAFILAAEARARPPRSASRPPRPPGAPPC